MTKDMVRLNAVDIGGICETLFEAAGVSREQREAVTRNIVWNELEGRRNFGLERLSIYFKRLRAGVINPSPELRKEIVAGGAAKIDGDNGFGQYTGETGMSLAIELAKASGIGACSVKQSNFFGSGAYFVSMAAEHKMAALAVSNSCPKVTAYGGRHAVLGTNPFAFGAPGPDDTPIIIDFSTGSLAGSTVRDYARAGQPLPDGLAVLPNGDWATDPNGIGEAALTPFGGAKGFGVALVVELLAGVLSGAGISHGVGSLYRDFDKPAESGHFFIAIDISRWLPPDEFHKRVSSLADALVSSAGGGAVRLPGSERGRIRQYHEREGVTVDEGTVQEINEIALSLGRAKLIADGNLSEISKPRSV